jgi:FKBP-type peptidyl-prolyl cis-trans isomerase SlyD
MTVSGACAMVVYQRKVYLHLLKFSGGWPSAQNQHNQPSSIFKQLIQLPMQITKNKVAAIHYTLRDNEGTIIDSSEGREPLHYLHGAGNLIMGMEEGLEGKGQGDKFSLKIAPEKGYGEKDDSLVQKVPRSAFGDQEVKPGMRFSTNQGGVVTVTNVGLESVTVDGNHPLAGVELNFAVEVIEVRNATSEELSHGHVHGAGGHQH